jgi:hypothetical protein
MSLAQVTIYVRVTDAQSRRHYERLNRRTPQLGPGTATASVSKSTANANGKLSAPTFKPPPMPV